MSVVAGFPWVLCPVVGAAGICGLSGVEDVTRGHVVRGRFPCRGWASLYGRLLMLGDLCGLFWNYVFLFLCGIGGAAVRVQLANDVVSFC